MNTAGLNAELTTLLEGHARLSEEQILPIVLANCENAAERELLEDNGVYGFLADQYSERNLLGFEWMSWGAPMSSSDTMTLLEMDRRTYLCLPPETLDALHDFVILGVASSDQPHEISDLVTRCLSRLVDGDFWPNRLPTETINYSADLVSRQAIKESYRQTSRLPIVWEELLADADKMLNKGEVSDEDLFDRWFDATYSESSSIDTRRANRM